MEELAELKSGLISRERYFLNWITKAFMLYYQLLILYVNRLRRAVFLIGKLWEGEDGTLYFRMKEILREVREDLKDSGRS
jgi:hypothetical protein